MTKRPDRKTGRKAERKKAKALRHLIEIRSKAVPTSSNVEGLCALRVDHRTQKPFSLAGETAVKKMLSLQTIRVNNGNHGLVFEDFRNRLPVGPRIPLHFDSSAPLPFAAQRRAENPEPARAPVVVVAAAAEFAGGVEMAKRRKFRRER